MSTSTKIRGQITTSARLRELTPDASYKIWFVSGKDLYEMTVTEHRQHDVKAELLHQRAGASKLPLQIDLRYDSLCLDGGAGSYKIFALRSRAEQYIEG